MIMIPSVAAVKELLEEQLHKLGYSFEGAVAMPQVMFNGGERDIAWTGEVIGERRSSWAKWSYSVRVSENNATAELFWGSYDLDYAVVSPTRRGQVEIAKH